MRVQGSWHLPEVKDPAHTLSQSLHRRGGPGEDDEGDLATHRPLPQPPAPLGDARPPPLSPRRRAERQGMEHLVEMLLREAAKGLPRAGQQAYRQTSWRA